MKKLLTIAIAITLLQASTLFAQNTQKFTVNVPPSISVTAPADVAITHDESNNDQAFAAQTWVVKGNTLNGVTVSFSTGTAFTHTTDPSFKRDALLGLALGTTTGPAGTTWTVDTASDQTDYANATPDEVATVAASSNGVGSADFDLAVTFITDTFGSFAAGAYETTVTGTISSN